MKKIMMMTVAVATLGGGVYGGAMAQDRSPAGQVFSVTALEGNQYARVGASGTITFDAGGNWTVHGIKDAMGSDPFSGPWLTMSNGEIQVDNDLFWMDPEAAGEDVPRCREWPDYPLNTPIQDVSGGWQATGVCWIGWEGGTSYWDIQRIE